MITTKIKTTNGRKRRNYFAYTPREIFPEWLRLEISNVVYVLVILSISLVMTDCTLSVRGQGHVSNFYIFFLF